jgi:hypothetical protein
MKKQARKPAGAVSRKFVTGMFSYDGGRQVTVYVPPDPPEAIIFASDGQRISKWGRMLKKADVPSTMIVGAHGLTDEMRSAHADVVMYERDESHGGAFWQEEFPLMVAWAFDDEAPRYRIGGLF